MVNMNNLTVKEFGKRLDLGADKMRYFLNNFCKPLGITTFAYVRIYHNGCASWLTSNPDQDRFLLESDSLDEDPHIDTAEVIKEGQYLWFNNRQFPGCEAFYRDRARLFQMDHGLSVVRHQKDYLENCCFSGLMSKAPLYNLFMNEKALFSTFMQHVTEQLDRRSLSLLEHGINLNEIKEVFGKPIAEPIELSEKRASLVAACGWQNLLQLSKREKQCLVLLRQGHTFQAIGAKLKLSARTVEHYIESVKNKLGVDTRSELFLAAEKLSQLGLA